MHLRLDLPLPVPSHCEARPRPVPFRETLDPLALLCGECLSHDPHGTSPRGWTPLPPPSPQPPPHLSFPPTATLTQRWQTRVHVYRFAIPRCPNQRSTAQHSAAQHRTLIAIDATHQQASPRQGGGVLSLGRRHRRHPPKGRGDLEVSPLARRLSRAPVARRVRRKRRVRDACGGVQAPT